MECVPCGVCTLWSVTCEGVPCGGWTLWNVDLVECDV